MCFRSSGHYREIGLSFLQGCLHPVYHSLHSFHVARHIRCGQTFPKSTEFRNSMAFHPFFGSPFPCFSVRIAKSVSLQLLQLPRRTNILGGQFWLSNESMSTSAMDYRILAPICTKYRLQKSIQTKLMDCTANIKFFNNTHIG